MCNICSSGDIQRSSIPHLLPKAVLVSKKKEYENITTVNCYESSSITLLAGFPV